MSEEFPRTATVGAQKIGHCPNSEEMSSLPQWLGLGGDFSKQCRPILRVDIGIDRRDEGGAIYIGTCNGR